MSAELSDEAVSLCIRTSAPADLCQELIDLFRSVEVAEAFIKSCAAQCDVGLPTPAERAPLVGDDDSRQARIGRNLLTMAAMAGGLPIGFGVPGRIEGQQWLEVERLTKRYYATPALAIRCWAPPQQPNRRPLAERKARRQKRKQRRRR